MAKPKIVFITANENKKREYEEIMSLYGLRIRCVGNLKDVPHDVDYVIREQSNLYDRNKIIITDLSLMQTCSNESFMSVSDIKSGYTKHYMDTVKGFINPTLHLQTADGPWFGFDDCFVIGDSGITYRDAALRGLKVSPRHNVISQFIESNIKPHDIKQHNHSDTRISGPLNMNNNVTRFIQNNNLVNQALSQDTEKSRFFESLLSNTLSTGLFFRSSGSQRESNYWFPGLNGGIPVVPKKDEIHELTFMMHDIMHHVSPDLIFDGNTTDDARKVYMIHRMIGEAMSMVMADYVFTDLMRDSGIEYDYTKRKIHPVFDYLMEHELAHIPTYQERIKELCRLNALYALTGKPLNVPDEIRIPYEEKYSRYFIEDYRWTDQNFRNVAQTDSRLGIFSEWEQHLNHEENDTLPISSMIPVVHNAQSIEDMVNNVFDETWYQFVKPKTVSNRLDNLTEDTSYKAFNRYMSGQSLLCFKYSHIPGMKEAGCAILEALNQHQDPEMITQVFDSLIDRLNRQNIISNDDAATFKNVFPVFNPFFVYYESKRPEYTNITETAKKLFPDIPVSKNIIDITPCA